MKEITYHSSSELGGLLINRPLERTGGVGGLVYHRRTESIPDIDYFYLAVKGSNARVEARSLLVTFKTRQMAAGDEMKSVT